ncbi:MAG: hypothetical protein AB1757_19385 [Acidobacteriota bacterium]
MPFEPEKAIKKNGLSSMRGSVLENLDWRDQIFGKFQRLVQIHLCNQIVEVPENNNLLRCFQFIKVEAISLGDYCWNGDCSNCLVDYRQENGEIKTAMACRMNVKPGLIITQLSENLKDDLLGG